MHVSDVFIALFRLAAAAAMRAAANRGIVVCTTAHLQRGHTRNTVRVFIVDAHRMYKHRIHEKCICTAELATANPVTREASNQSIAIKHIA